MDGRDFGPQRSVHGPPPPLLSGLAMDSHRVGAATAGRLPSSGLPGPLPPGKYMAGLNLHPHPGKCPAPCSSPPVFPGRSTRPGPPVHSRPGLGDSPSVGHGGAGGLSSQGWETPGPGAKASPALGCLFCSVLGPCKPKADAVARATGGDSNPRGPGGTSLGWSFQNLGEKRTNRPPHPARHPLPELESFSWQTLLLAPVGPPGFCSQLHHPRRAGTVISALGPWPRGGRRPRPSGTPCSPARKTVRRRGRDTETGPPRSRT
uniref:Uncharacterized protein n=1 Tax=Nomascus leucogenys TaxID=61853 RepID=A0A2I3GX45_NOMLE